MNEKRKIEPDLDPDNPDDRPRSDVAPKHANESGAAARHISGLRPAVQLPPLVEAVPPAPLTPEDLLEDLEDGWDDDDNESGPTLLDPKDSVSRAIVADARAVADPIAEPETQEVATRELAPRGFDQDEAPTGEMPTVQNTLAESEESEQDEDDEFSHDDFPTRQTPAGLQQALLAYPVPTDSQRGLHETLPPPTDDSAPDLPSSPSFSPTVAQSVAPVSPLAASLAAPVPASADETAQMPGAPPLPRLDELTLPPPPADSSSISQISQISQVSYASQASHASLVSHASQVSRPLVYPTPTSITGAPLPPASTVRFAFLRNLSPNNDPPLHKLVTVAAIAFFATLVLSAFVAWIIVLVRH